MHQYYQKKLKFIQCFGSTFKLSLSGFDCVAINKLREMGLNQMGSPIGIGKESDIYLGQFKKQDVAITQTLKKWVNQFFSTTNVIEDKQTTELKKASKSTSDFDIVAKVL